MKPTNWQNITPQYDGEIRKLPPGGYVCKIVNMINVPEREYVMMVYDIAQGEYAGFYSNDNREISKQWSHAISLSYKDTANALLKGRMERIEKSNPGFNPFAAWDAERFDMFAGRLFGGVIGEEEYEASDGTIKIGMKLQGIYEVATITSGQFKVPALKPLNKNGKKPAGSQTTLDVQYANSVDVPFA